MLVARKNSKERQKYEYGKEGNVNTKFVTKNLNWQ